MPEREAATANANRLIAYHSPISAAALTTERTSLESQLIPVTAYIVVACAETVFRYPELLAQVDAARSAEAIGVGARRPGCQVDTCFLWSISNFYLVGRKVAAVLLPGIDTPERGNVVLDFWERAAMAYRGNDGTRQAWDTGTSTPYDATIISELLEGSEPVSGEELDRVKRFNATLVNYLFLLYFDTRAGYGDTGPYDVPGHPNRKLLVRDFYRLGRSDFAWSDVAENVPYNYLTAAFVLEDIDFHVTDFGTSNHTPEDYLDHVVSFGLFAPDPTTGALTSVPRSELDSIVAEVRKAQSQHYRNIAAMTRDEKIQCGAYVYFSFARPFAVEAGVADQIDWTVPRDLPAPAYEMIAAMTGGNEPPPDEPGEYYEPYA